MSIKRFGIRISGPLAGFAEGYGTELTQLGYAPASVRLQLKVLADLSGWLLSQGMAAADLRRSDLDRFLRHRRAARRDHPGLPACRSGDQGARIG